MFDWAMDAPLQSGKKRRNISLFLGIYGEVITSKRISVRYSGDAYSFQCGMQSLIWGG